MSSISELCVSQNAPSEKKNGRTAHCNKNKNSVDSTSLTCMHNNQSQSLHSSKCENAIFSPPQQMSKIKMHINSSDSLLKRANNQLNGHQGTNQITCRPILIPNHSRKINVLSRILKKRGSYKQQSEVKNHPDHSQIGGFLLVNCHANVEDVQLTRANITMFFDPIANVN